MKILSAIFLLLLSLFLPVQMIEHFKSHAQGSSGKQVQNQNQIQTQNQGDEKQLQTQTKEEEQTGTMQQTSIESQNRSQNAQEHISSVAAQVQKLQMLRTEGGVGEEVRQIAQDQNKAQDIIGQNVEKLNSRGRLKKLLLGTDYHAIKSINTEIEQNQLRIARLEQIQTRLTNQDDTTMIQATIQSLVNQNTALQEQIQAEEQTKSMFGWIFRFFAK
ncbi:MAG: hypothetical protein WC489_02220 [Patescibacteria group bacterium]